MKGTRQNIKGRNTPLLGQYQDPPRSRTNTRPSSPTASSSKQPEESINPEEPSGEQPEPLKENMSPKIEPKASEIPDENDHQDNGKGVAPPTPFNGDRTKVDAFIKECALFFQGNPKKFTDGKQKTLAALSYLKGGDALTWKEQYLEDKMDKDTYEVKVGDWKDWVKEFKQSFLLQLKGASP
jgi:hypothetical protein